MIDVGEASQTGIRLAEYAAELAQRVQVLREVLSKDPRIAAAWIYGSLARGDGDHLSDIDVRVVVHEREMLRALADRYDFVAELGEPIMVQEAPQNRPPGGAYNMVWYAGAHAPHAVDWTWSSSETTRIPTGMMLVHNRAGLEQSGEPMEFAYQPVPERDRREEIRQALHGFWSMLLVVAKHAARNPFEERMGLLQWTIPQLRESQQFAGVDPGPAFAGLAPHPEPAEKMDVLRALAAEASALTGALAERGVIAPVRMEPHALNYLDLVEAVMGSR
jgi:predicted nucleotidyltransferase